MLSPLLEYVIGDKTTEMESRRCSQMEVSIFDDHELIVFTLEAPSTDSGSTTR